MLVVFKRAWHLKQMTTIDCADIQNYIGIRLVLRAKILTSALFQHFAFLIHSKNVSNQMLNKTSKKLNIRLIQVLPI